jgi:hypothetical protein
VGIFIALEDVVEMEVGWGSHGRESERGTGWDTGLDEGTVMHFLGKTAPASEGASQWTQAVVVVIGW